MNKAYLITAYDQPGHLARLIQALQCSEARFFVHIDRRTAAGPFREALASQPNIAFVEPHSINWMGFSQVESILTLMRAAVAERSDYYTLLSGSDYPIKSNQRILHFFENSREEFITFWKLSDRPSWLHKIEHYYPIDLVPILNYESASFRRYFWGYFYKVANRFPKRRYIANLVPYGGCQWWSLSHDCVRYILNFVSQNPRITGFYRHTHCPSEMFFQTIILNSETAARVRGFKRYTDWSAATSIESKRREDCMLPEDSFNFRYVDWDRQRTGGLGRPAVLDERDFAALRDSPDLFARKLCEPVSDLLLDRIDRELLTSDALSAR
jgi:hypothetical protein